MSSDSNPFDFSGSPRLTPLPSGRYRIELVAGSWRPFSNRGGSGVQFMVRIAEPAGHAGREVWLSLMLHPLKDTTRRIAERDLEVLHAWAERVSAPGGSTMQEGMKSLWRASNGRQVWADLVVTKDQRGLPKVEIRELTVEPQDAPPAEPAPPAAAAAMEADDGPF